MRLFKKYVLSNCFESLYVIVAPFNVTKGLKLSESTGKRYMKKLRLHCFVAVQKPFLSKKNLSASVTWARTHQYWTLEKWMQVVFTDESSFTVSTMKN